MFLHQALGLVYQVFTQLGRSGDEVILLVNRYVRQGRSATQGVTGISGAVTEKMVLEMVPYLLFHDGGAQG